MTECYLLHNTRMSRKTITAVLLIFLLGFPLYTVAQSGSRPIADLILIESFKLQEIIASHYNEEQNFQLKYLDVFWQKPDDWEDSGVRDMGVIEQGVIQIMFDDPDDSIITLSPVISDDGLQVTTWQCETGDIPDIALTWLGCSYTGEAQISNELIMIVNEVARFKALVSGEYMMNGSLPDAGDINHSFKPDWTGTRVASISLQDNGLVELRLIADEDSPAGVVLYTPVVTEGDEQVNQWNCHSPDIPDIRELLDQCIYSS